MKFVKSLALTAALAAVFAGSAQAQVRITEVAPWSSGVAPISADWFEVTNIGLSVVNISGWKFDDNSNSFAASVALNGITAIAAGESVIFIESAGSPATTFKNLWFGPSAPANLQIGTYSGSGVGLSTAGDAVNLYNAAGNLQANVSFGISPTGTYSTFDNSALINGGTISTLSVAGVNGAFLAAQDPLQIGSPGSVEAVPEPESYAMLLAGLGVMGALVKRRKGRYGARAASLPGKVSGFADAQRA